MMLEDIDKIALVYAYCSTCPNTEYYEIIYKINEFHNVYDNDDHVRNCLHLTGRVMVLNYGEYLGVIRFITHSTIDSKDLVYNVSYTSISSSGNIKKLNIEFLCIRPSSMKYLKKIADKYRNKTKQTK